MQLRNCGSIILFAPDSPDEREWLKDNVQADAQWFGGSLAVEPRYARALVQGVAEAGFDVT